jgi:hypothetical protein
MQMFLITGNFYRRDRPLLGDSGSAERQLPESPGIDLKMDKRKTKGESG